MGERETEFLDLLTRDSLAKWLGITDGQLRFLLYKQTEQQRYRTFMVPKRRGGQRQIAAPIGILAYLQRRIARALNELSPPRVIAKGYVKGRGIADHAAVHARRKWVVCIDLEDYFPSINFGRVLGMFMGKPFGLPREVAVCLAQICCFNGSIPQGAPTSPVISNIVARQLDRRLAEFARKYRVSVSRYADDLAFSSNISAPPLALVDAAGGCGEVIQDIVKSCGFKVNISKFKMMRGGDRKFVTGLVVNSRPAMPRSWRRQTRVMLHLRETLGDEAALDIVSGFRSKRLNRKPSSVEQIVRGRAAFATHLDERFGSKFVESLVRSFSGQRDLFSSVRRFGALSVITEGATDKRYIAKAFQVLAASDRRLAGMRLTFSDVPDREAGFGDEALRKHLQELASYNLPVLTIGLFDCDNQKLLRDLNIGPGLVNPLGPSLAAACLPKPRTDDSAYCIEHFVPVEFRFKSNADGRRLYGIEEFDSTSGLHKSGRYYRTHPKKSTLIVDSDVFSTEGGASVALSKMEFCDLLCEGRDSFDGFDWEHFRPVVEFLADISMNWPMRGEL